MKISILEYTGDQSGPYRVDTYVEQLAELRDEGFGRMWSAQLPYERDLLTALAVAFREVDTIEVATGVLPIQNQHPMLLAQRALTLNAIAGGRFTLGIGMTHALVTEGMWGISWAKPIRRLTEYLDGLLPLLNGQPADATGELVTTRGALHIPGAPAPEVYVAALGPQMLRVAGRRTAGTVTWMTGPATLETHIGSVLRSAATEAGRPEGAVRVVAVLPVSVTDDVDAARKRAADEYVVYGQLPSYRAMLDREGYAGPEDAALIGDEQTVSERLDQLRAAGVDEFVGATFDPSAEGRARTRALLRRWAG
ncbi:TIGR03564 family F420-dependent LLM class oxidoreductase [Mycolicibacterium mengxianglii]|uniref:TIGR03564 family F420-dependent LLM class oxidoreductase n=1 Tax=Mycolicibacterium mengxianglii TaxID=2736649 RepID=UPI0018D10314|nr:TIGR03564 family F420-dependent LLM class oxidoreductase [Mycolicibacterium mengxianglii]